MYVYVLCMYVYVLYVCVCVAEFVCFSQAPAVGSSALEAVENETVQEMKRSWQTLADSLQGAKLDSLIMYVLYACMYDTLFLYVCMHVCMYVCMYDTLIFCMYICMYLLRMYVCNV